MLRKKTPSATLSILMVSHGYDFQGGGEIGFRDVMLGIQERLPDIDLVAVYPRAGMMVADARQIGVATKVGLVPWWAHTDRRIRILKIAKRTALLIVSICQAIWHLARLRPTLVVTNTMVIPSYAVAAKILGIQHCWIIREFGRDDHGFRFALGYERTIHLIRRLSALVICNSRAVERAMLNVEPRMKTAVLYPAVDPFTEAPPRRRQGGPFRAVLVGRLAPSKGQHVAIEAVATARGLGVEINLDIIGGGDRTPFDALSRRLGVDDLVNIHGKSDNVSRYLAAAHVGLMCSVCEAFGRVTVEAMSAGLPVCGTDTGGTSEIIVQRLNGLLSPAGDANALARNLIDLALDEDLRLDLALGAMETARRFERVRFNDGLEKILTQMLLPTNEKNVEEGELPSGIRRNPQRA